VANDFYAVIIPAFLPSVISAFDLSYFKAGTVAFSALILSAVFQPVAGYVTDLYSRRKMGLIGGFGLAAVAVFSLGFVPNYALLVTVCLLLGLGLSVYHPQSTNFLTMYFTERSGMAMGIHGVGGSLGNVLAPVAAGFLISLLGWRKTAVVLSLPAILAASFISLRLREPTLKGGKGFFQGLNPPLLLLGLVYGLNTAVHRGLVSFLPAFYVSTGATISRAGLLTSVMLTAGLIAQPIGGMLFDRIGGRKAFLFSLTALSFAVIAFTRSGGILGLCISFCVAFCFYLVFPVGLVFASQLAGKERVGSSVGLVFGCCTTFGSFSPMLVGYLIDVVGFQYAFLSLAGVALTGAILAYFLPGGSKDR